MDTIVEEGENFVGVPVDLPTLKLPIHSWKTQFSFSKGGLTSP
jgi:hypothetical protein